MARNHSTIIAGLLLLSLSIRIVGIALTELLGINPFGQAQVNQHDVNAEAFASHYLAMSSPESLPAPGSTDIANWARILSIFWMIPGPSGLYAQLAMAVFGTIGSINLYFLGSYFHSKQAGILAALPVILFPTYFLMHSVIQREAFILLTMTSAAVLVFHPRQPFSQPYNYIFALTALFGVGFVRQVNFSVLIAVVIVIIGTYLLQSRRFSLTQKAVSVASVSLLGTVSLILMVQYIAGGVGRFIDYFYNLRDRRLRGRATYLEDVIPETFPEFIAFSVPGAIYFLFAPFPWHIETLRDIPVVAESIITIGYAVFAIHGIRVLYQRSILLTVGLVSATVLFSVAFGYGTGNYGTGLRHRQVIVWAIFLLGAIGISDKIRIKL